MSCGLHRQFCSKEFFTLEKFEHSALFSESEPAWKALEKISAYLNSMTLGKIEARLEEGVFLINPETISIGEGSVVESGAYIRGPCLVGKDCQIRHGAYIRGNVITGNRCVIGHGTEIKNAIFLDEVQAGHFAYIGDSILGNRVNLGAGTKCANLRLDRRSVPIALEKMRIDSGLRKLGAVIGDGSQLGCNCVTNPGTIMGRSCLFRPCQSILGVYSDNHVS